MQLAFLPSKKITSPDVHKIKARRKGTAQGKGTTDQDAWVSTALCWWLPAQTQLGGVLFVLRCKTDGAYCGRHQV